VLRVGTRVPALRKAWPVRDATPPECSLLVPPRGRKAK